jgi:hypothetical protein
VFPDEWELWHIFKISVCSECWALIWIGDHCNKDQSWNFEIAGLCHTLSFTSGIFTCKNEINVSFLILNLTSDIMIVCYTSDFCIYIFSSIPCTLHVMLSSIDCYWIWLYGFFFVLAKLDIRMYLFIFFHNTNNQILSNSLYINHKNQFISSSSFRHTMFNMMRFINSGTDWV